MMDGTANETPMVTIKGFPTLILYRAPMQMDPVTYDGHREVDDLIKFVLAHAQGEAAPVSDGDKAEPADGDDKRDEL